MWPTVGQQGHIIHSSRTSESVVNWFAAPPRDAQQYTDQLISGRDMLTRNMRSRTRSNDAVQTQSLPETTNTCEGQRAPSAGTQTKKGTTSSTRPILVKGQIVSSSTNDMPIIVSESDVLMGRGRHIESHEGNVQFHLRMEQHLRGYKVLRARPAKNRYTAKIVKQMKKSGIRFLKQNIGSGGAWYEVDDEIARMKVGQSLRYLRRRNSSNGTQTPKSKEVRSRSNSHKPLGSGCPDNSPQLDADPDDGYAMQGPVVGEIDASSDHSFDIYLEDWDEGIPANSISSSRKGVRVDDFFMPDV